MQELFNTLATILICCCVPFIVTVGGITYFYKLIKLSNSRVDEPLKAAQIWFRTGLVTYRGLGLIALSFLTLWLATQSIELSTLSTIGLFFLISFLLIWIYAQLINLYLLVKSRGSDKELIESSVNYHFLKENDALRHTLNLNLPKPLGFLIKLRVILPPELGDEIRITGIEGDQIEVIPEKTKRGEHKLGPVIVTYSDLFGMTHIMLRHDSKDTLKIVPNVNQIQNLDWKVPTNKIGDDTGVKQIINTDELYDVKKYVRGDDVRRIHWKLSAKKSNLMMRKAEMTFVTTGRFMVVIDNQLPRNTGVGDIRNKSGNDLALDRMVDVAASILDFSQRYKLPVKVFFFNKEGDLQEIKPSNETREKWLRKLAEVGWVKANSNSFRFNLSKSQLDSLGFFLLTAETSIRRLKTMNNSIKAFGVNFIYFPLSSYLKIDENGDEDEGSSLGAKFLSLIFTKTSYVERKSLGDYWRERLMRKNVKLNKTLLASLKSRAEAAEDFLRKVFPELKVIAKNNNYVRILEGKP